RKYLRNYCFSFVLKEVGGSHFWLVDFETCPCLVLIFGYFDVSKLFFLGLKKKICTGALINAVPPDRGCSPATNTPKIIAEKRRCAGG
ncbi:hypothetical protein ACQWFV_24690, partial [Salmonella enterica subsp. enterica serovar Infantis]